MESLIAPSSALRGCRSCLAITTLRNPVFVLLAMMFTTLSARYLTRASRHLRNLHHKLAPEATSTMTDDTTDLLNNYLLLDTDGTAVLLPGGGDFWNQLMSGAATDPGIRRLMGSEKGRLLAALPMSADWTNWEMHPAGDEILFMLEGKATFILDLADGLKEIVLGAGRLL